MGDRAKVSCDRHRELYGWRSDLSYMRLPQSLRSMGLPRRPQLAGLLAMTALFFGYWILDKKTMIPETLNLKRHPVFIWIICTCLVSFLAPGNNAHAAQADNADVEQSSRETEGDASQARTWEQLTPSASRFDWIQLTSDEWLKGDLESLYDGKVEFDSDELDLLVLDWEDVKKVRHTREPSSSAWNRLIVALGIDF